MCLCSADEARPNSGEGYLTPGGARRQWKYPLPAVGWFIVQQGFHNGETKTPLSGAEMKKRSLNSTAYPQLLQNKTLIKPSEYDINHVMTQVWLFQIKDGFEEAPVNQWWQHQVSVSHGEWCETFSQVPPIKYHRITSCLDWKDRRVTAPTCRSVHLKNMLDRSLCSNHCFF